MWWCVVVRFYGVRVRDDVRV
ncbi:MAG: hypothetical protein RL076_2851, partial [Chloroflexota bacterium]